MTSKYNNDILFNAAIAGITAGCLDGKDFTQISAASLASAGGLAQQSAILAAAIEIDSLIAQDATLSVGTGDGTLLVTAFSTGTAAEAMPILSKPALLAELCMAAFSGQNPQSASAASYSVLAAGVAAQYKVSALGLLAS
jgi:hypothetical protein